MTTTRTRSRRRGTTIILAMVCLVLVATLCASMVRLAGSRRALDRGEDRRLQAEWLAESGAGRAAARLAADRAYRGETWDVATLAHGPDADGRVTITVEAVDGRPTRRRVRVVAEYPRGAVAKAVQSKHLFVDLKPEPTGGPQ